MKRKSGFSAAVIMIIVLFVIISCSKQKVTNIENKSNDTIHVESITQIITLEEKLNEFSEKEINPEEIYNQGLVGGITEIDSDKYLRYYGENKNDIIKRLGTGYEIIEIDRNPLYLDITEKIVYPGMEFYFFRDDDDTASYIFALEVWLPGEQYYGNIIIGCDLYTIIRQLGKPSSIKNDNILFYDAFYFEMEFTINNEFKLERISARETFR